MYNWQNLQKYFLIVFPLFSNRFPFPLYSFSSFLLSTLPFYSRNFLLSQLFTLATFLLLQLLTIVTSYYRYFLLSLIPSFRQQSSDQLTLALKMILGQKFDINLLKKRMCY